MKKIKRLALGALIVAGAGFAAYHFLLSDVILFR